MVSKTIDGGSNPSLPAMRKRITLFLLLFFFAILCYSHLNNDSIKNNNDSVAEYVIKSAVRYIGVPYRYGSNSPKKGFDCSGFTSYIYKMSGFDLHRTAIKQYKQGNYVEKHELKPGDLVFFKGRKSNDVGHVGIVMEVLENSFNFIHSCDRGVSIDNSKVSYYNKRYIGAKRFF